MFSLSPLTVECFRFFFFFQAEDGIRDLVRSRGLGDVYKRQPYTDADQCNCDFVFEMKGGTSPERVIKAFSTGLLNVRCFNGRMNANGSNSSGDVVLSSSANVMLREGSTDG